MNNIELRNPRQEYIPQVKEVTKRRAKFIIYLIRLRKIMKMYMNDNWAEKIIKYSASEDVFLAMRYPSFIAKSPSRKRKAPIIKQSARKRVRVERPQAILRISLHS